jgi:pyrimidine deaminase RibD-like protein
MRDVDLIRNWLASGDNDLYLERHYEQIYSFVIRVVNRHAFGIEYSEDDKHIIANDIIMKINNAKKNDRFSRRDVNYIIKAIKNEITMTHDKKEKSEDAMDRKSNQENLERFHTENLDDKESECTDETLNIPNDTVEDEEVLNFRQNLIMNNMDYYGNEIGHFLYRYYSLKGVVKDNGVQPIPDMERIKTILEKSTGQIIENTPSDFNRKRRRILNNFSERYYMEMCVNLLKKGIEQFDKEIKQKHFSEEERKTTPMLSAVAVDKDGKLIAGCYKGQVVSCKIHDNWEDNTCEDKDLCFNGVIVCEKDVSETDNEEKSFRRTFQKHCEYTLLEEIITSPEDKERLKGGTFFVTLEPCNKRGTYHDAHGRQNKKTPCAVRCLESGISKIYIGMFDTDKKVTFKGIEILKTGKYTFDLDESGKHKSNEPREEKRRDIIESQGKLEEEFKDKEYISQQSDSTKRVYQIRANGLELKGFDEDIINEICALNAVFLEKKGKRFGIYK